MCFPGYVKYKFNLQNSESSYELHNEVPLDEPSPPETPPSPTTCYPKVIQDTFKSLTTWESRLERLEDLVHHCVKLRYKGIANDSWMTLTAVNILAKSSKKDSEGLLLSLKICADYFDNKGDHARRVSFQKTIDWMELHLCDLGSEVFKTGKQIIKLLKFPIYFGEAEEQDLKMEELRNKKEELIVYLRALKDVGEEVVSQLKEAVADSKLNI